MVGVSKDRGAQLSPARFQFVYKEAQSATTARMTLQDQTPQGSVATRIPLVAWSREGIYLQLYSQDARLKINISFGVFFNCLVTGSESLSHHITLL